jgi:hypothetical protein
MKVVNDDHSNRKGLCTVDFDKYKVIVVTKGWVFSEYFRNYLIYNILNLYKIWADKVSPLPLV